MVLTVDAQAGRLDSYAASLVEDDRGVLSATSDDDALALLETQAVDVVLLDDHDGLALVEEIQARGHDVVVIVLSQEPNMVWAREAMRLGVYAYVSRPCDPKLLRVMLADLHAKRRETGCGE